MERTKKHVLRLVSQLDQRHSKPLLTEVKHLLASGGIDFTADPAMIAKAVYYVALGHVRENWRPLSDEGKKLVKNLQHF